MNRGYKHGRLFPSLPSGLLDRDDRAGKPGKGHTRKRGRERKEEVFSAPSNTDNKGRKAERDKEVERDSWSSTALSKPPLFFLLPPTGPNVSARSLSSLCTFLWARGCGLWQGRSLFWLTPSFQPALLDRSGEKSMSITHRRGEGIGGHSEAYCYAVQQESTYKRLRCPAHPPFGITPCTSHRFWKIIVCSNALLVKYEWSDGRAAKNMGSDAFDRRGKSFEEKEPALEESHSPILFRPPPSLG